MKKKLLISIITPTYNEIHNIDTLIREVFHYTKPFSKKRGYSVELIIVDDNSPDGTADAAALLLKKYHITIIRREAKLGLSSAVMEGLAVAKGDIIGVMDADLSHPPDMVPKMIDSVLCEGYDIVFGSRLTEGGQVEQWPATRKLISMVATTLAKPLTSVSDPLSGFFFFRKKVIGRVKLSPIGYKIGLEILVKGRYCSLKEVPYVFRNRGFGTSKLNLKEYFNYLRHLFRLYRYKAHL